MSYTAIGRDWRRRLVVALFKRQEGLCHWCRKACRLHDHPLYKRSTGALSGKAATLDHLYSKMHPLRYQTVNHEKYVMACSTCNGKRSKAECLAGLQEKPRPVVPPSTSSQRKEKE